MPNNNVLSYALLAILACSAQHASAEEVAEDGNAETVVEASLPRPPAIVAPKLATVLRALMVDDYNKWHWAMLPSVQNLNDVNQDDCNLYNVGRCVTGTIKELKQNGDTTWRVDLASRPMSNEKRPQEIGIKIDDGCHTSDKDITCMFDVRPSLQAANIEYQHICSISDVATDAEHSFDIYVLSAPEKLPLVLITDDYFREYTDNPWTSSVNIVQGSDDVAKKWCDKLNKEVGPLPEDDSASPSQ